MNERRDRPDISSDPNRTMASDGAPDGNGRGLSRRRLLAGAGAFGAAALPGGFPRLAFRSAAAPQRGDILVVIFQRGGMDGLSAVVPFTEQAYYDKRPRIAFKPPKAGDGKTVIGLDDRFGLNPALTGLKRIWDDGRLGVVHATGAPHGSRSHFDAMSLMERGALGAQSLTTGWLGRYLSATAQRNASPFRALGVGPVVPESLRGPVPAAALQNIADMHLGGNTADIVRFQALLEQLWCAGDWFASDARSTFQALDLLAKADPASHAPENGAQYPDDELGQGLKQIAQLIKADLGLEVACIDNGGWDTHANQIWGWDDPTRGMMFNLLNSLDKALLAFYQDLGRRFDDPGVTVLTMSEFGRRVAQNAGNGTDHGHGSCMFAISGGVKRAVHTEWPGLAPEALAEGEDLAITIDYRDILAELLAKRLGNPRVFEVFPNYTPTDRGVFQARPDAAPAITARPSLYFPAALRNAVR
ncbi:MAG: DUF1501 domain-containing protein [Ardenticatenales bacterium]|nr:DUF1501 domain-containing protein [Ardenticatenales bacterium]